MKLLLFILGLTLCTASPTLRGLRSTIIDFPGQDLAGPEVVSGEEQEAFDDLAGWVFDDPFSGDGDFDRELVAEYALEEETVFNEAENAEEAITEEEENWSVPPPQEEEEEQTTTPDEPEDLLTQIQGDAVTKDVFDFGVDTVVNQGIQAEKIPNVGLKVSSVSAYSKTSDANGELYKFSCEANSPDGTSVLSLNFTVYYDFATERKTLSAYSYSVKTTTNTNNGSTTPSGDSVALSVEEINTAVVQNALNYGWSQIYAQGTQNGKIPVSEFNIVSIVGVWKQVKTNGASYRCEVVLENQKNATVRANYTVNYNSATQQNTLAGFSYTIREVDTTDLNGNNTANGYTELSASEIEAPEVQAVLTFGTNKILQSGYNKSKIPVSEYSITKVISVARRNATNGRTLYKCELQMQDVKKVLIHAAFAVTASANQALSIGSWTYNVSNIRNPPKPDNNTTNPTTPNTTNPTTPGNETNTNGYVELNATEIQDAEVQTVLKAGTDEIIASGIQKGKIPASQYNITKTNVSRKNLTNTRTGYRCNVELKDAQGAWITTEFSVTVNQKNGNVNVGKWNYNIWIPNNYNYTNTTNPTTPNNTDTTTPNNTDTTNTTIPTNPTTPVDNTTTPVIPPNTTNTTTTDGYTQLSAAEIAEAEVQAVLKAGTDEIIASGIKKGKIPASQYNITKTDVSRKNVTSTRTGYRCDVELKDVQGAWVRAQFNATVNQRNAAVDVGAWTYNIWIPRNYNYTLNNNTNTNTTAPVDPTTPVNNTTPETNTTVPETNTTVPTIPVNNTTPETNTTIPTNTTNTDGYVQLSAAEIADAEVQAVLKAGTDEIVASAIRKGKVPASQYSITKFNNVSRKNLTSTRTGYKCDVELEDAQGAWVRAQFNATVNPRTAAVDVNGWTSNTFVPRRYNYNLTNNTNTTNNNTTVPVVPTTETPAQPANNTTVVDNTTNTTPVVNTTANDFTQLGQSQIQDTEVQAVLAYGADQVIQKGIARGRIPQSQYNVTKVVSVAKKNQVTNGKNTYNCDVELIGANNVTVKAQFSATVNVATQEKALASWAYSVGNIPK